MMKYLLALILLLPALVNAEENIQYFPKGKLYPINDPDDEIAIQSLSSVMEKMQEPSLFQRAKDKQQIECYRFYWDSPFQNKICIRIEIPESGKIKIYTKIFKYYEKNYDVFEKGLTKREKRVSKKDIQPLLEELNKIDFWNLKSKDFPAQNQDDGSFVMDAASYFFEGVKNNEYQFVEIIMLPDSLREKIYRFGHLFFSLSDVHKDDFDYMKND
jgi:hypothetical protein